MTQLLKTCITLVMLICFPSSVLAFQVYYYDTDATGTPIAVVDTVGNQVWKGEYYPFGEERSIQKTPGSNNRRLIGKEKDDETGLTYFDARYMNAGSGRFLTPDPVRPVDEFTSETKYVLLTQPQRLNRYAYGLNNPYRYVDLDGRDPIDPNTGKTNEVTKCHVETHNDPEKELIGVSIMATAAGGFAVEALVARGIARFGSSRLASIGSNKAPDFVVSPAGTAYPVPKGAQGPKPVINPQGKQTGTAFTSGTGGTNKQVDTMRIMDPTPPRGKSPGYPGGYIKYENKGGQGVDPYTGGTIPNTKSHYPID